MAEALLEVDDLHVVFPSKEGAVHAVKRRQLRPVP